MKKPKAVVQLTDDRQICRGFDAADVGNIASLILQLTVLDNQSSSLAFADHCVLVPSFDLLVPSEPLHLIGFFRDGAHELRLLTFNSLLVLRATDELGCEFYDGQKGECKKEKVKEMEKEKKKKEKKR